MVIHRRPPVYDAQERAVLELRKNDYLAAGSKEGRKQVLREILASIFNHWSSQGKVIDNHEQTSKEVAAWVRNTWRLPKSAESAPKIQIHVKLTDVLWLTREKDVLAEIATLLNVPEATTTTPGWFGARMKAMGNIIRRMSPEEKAALETHRDQLCREGHSEEVKRKMAAQYAQKRLSATAQQHWMEMGVLSLTIFVRTTPQGQHAVEIHDKIAQTLGVVASPFATMFNPKAVEMKRMVLNYVKALEAMLQPANGIPGAAPTADKTKLVLHDGFPKLPKDFDLKRYAKKELEEMYKSYIGQQYWVAGKHRTHQAPWKRMRVNTSKYVDAEYLPRPNFVLDKPRAMNFDALREFFAHIAEREKTFEGAGVFWFKHTDKRRNGDQQEDEDDEDDEDGIPNDESGAGDTAGAESHPEGRLVTESNHGLAEMSNQAPSANEDPQPATGADLPPRPRATPRPVPRPVNRPVNQPSNGTTEETSNQAPSANHDPQAPTGAEFPPRPRAKPRPVPRPVNQPSNEPEERSNQDPSADDDPQLPTGAEGIPRPRTKPRRVSRSVNRSVDQSSNGPPVETSNQAPSTNDTPTGAEGPPRPRAKPRPVPRPVNRPVNHPSNGPTEETSTQAPSTNDNPQPPTGAEGPPRPHAKPLSGLDYVSSKDTHNPQ